MMSDGLIVIGILFYCHSVILIEALKKYVTHLLLLFDAMEMVQVDVVAIEFDKAHAFPPFVYPSSLPVPTIRRELFGLSMSRGEQLGIRREDKRMRLPRP